MYPNQFPDLVLTHVVIMCGKVSLSLSLDNVTVAERDSESHRTVGGITQRNLALCLNTRWPHMNDKNDENTSWFVSSV